MPKSPRVLSTSLERQTPVRGILSLRKIYFALQSRCGAAAMGSVVVRGTWLHATWGVVGFAWIWSYDSVLSPKACVGSEPEGLTPAEASPPVVTAHNAG